ncbi:MAG: ATP-binding protein [Candidatus Sericytochromatia bacterium]|nr:ATP-binding protein [Candidatus Tanganyikabacteria bacterium]
MTTPAAPIKPRDRDAILLSLGSGVVPRTGHMHIQVGRTAELKALLADVERIAQGGSAFRLVIGDYGAGKTFFLHLVRAIALEKRLVAVHADLTPDKRLQAAAGQARGLYTELMKNMATRSRPEGGAMASVLERFVTRAISAGEKTGAAPEQVIRTRLARLEECVGGFDLARVVAAYWQGFDRADDRLQTAAVRWLRGEYATRSEARTDLGVRTIVDDASFYDHLKLLARFVRMAGYEGLLVCLDELVNLYKLSHTQARNANYERILTILNDCLQGGAEGLGFLLGGTPEFLLDTRRGLYGYPALQSRLAENAFATGGLIDHSGPVLRLASLTAEDFYVLLLNIRNVHAGGDASRHVLPEAGLTAFLDHCSRQIGDRYFRTPRTCIKAFVNLLAVLDQNPGARWEDLLGTVEVQAERDPALEPVDGASGGGSGGVTGEVSGGEELIAFRLN